MIRWKDHAKPNSTMVHFNFSIFPSLWKTLGELVFCFFFFFFYLGQWYELCFSCCKAIEYLDENTKELIQYEMVCLNFVSNALVLGIQKTARQIPESKTSLNLDRRRRWRVFCFSSIFYDFHIIQWSSIEQIKTWSKYIYTSHKINATIYLFTFKWSQKVQIKDVYQITWVSIIWRNVLLAIWTFRLYLIIEGRWGNMMTGFELSSYIKKKKYQLLHTRSIVSLICSICIHQHACTEPDFAFFGNRPQ